MSNNSHVVYIEGRASNEYANKDISILVTNKTSGDIIHLNQIKTDDDSEYSYKFMCDTDL